VIEGDDPLIGAVLNERYEIVGRVGAGAMGSVYRARQLRLGRDVAVKVLSGEVDRRARRRLHREARAVARISDPHVVAVHDYGETAEGDPYLVMELVPGPTVSTWRRGEPDLPAILAAADGMLAGLAAAHARDVLHRDLKPANMLVRDGDPSQVVLVDFGIAAVLSGETMEEPLTREGTVVGTPLYMSPEQAMGQHVGPEGDVYAAAVVIYEWLTGQPPFVGSVEDVMRSHAFRPPPPLVPRARLGDVPREVVDVVLQALSKRPAARFADAGAMREALRHREARPSAAAPAETQPADTLPSIATGAVAPLEPFVGREDEMKQLATRFAAVEAGRGGLLWLEGPPGAGVSRLLSEFVSRLSQEGRALVGRGSSGTGGLSTLRQAVEDLLGSRAAGIEGLRARLEATPGLDALGDAERDALIAWLRPEAAPEKAEGRWVVGLVERFLRLLARTRPVVLLLDGIEQDGEPARAWLDTFAGAQRLEPFPVWALVTRSRSGEGTGETSVVRAHHASDIVDRMAISLLTDSEIAELAGALLPLTPRAARLVADKAAGSPLIAVQLVRHLEDRGALLPMGARLDLDPDALRGALPASLGEFLGHRLDAATAASSAPELAERLLEVAAALGSTFRVDELAAGLSAIGETVSADGLDQLLDELIGSGVLLEPRGTAEDALQWEHPALVQLVRRRLGGSRRGRRRARDLGRAMLGWEDARRSALAHDLVAILEVAGETDLLPAPAFVAAEQAFAAGRLGDASRLLGHAAHGSSSRRARALRAEIHRLEGRYDDAVAAYEELLEESDDPGHLLVGLGRSLAGAGRFAEAGARLSEGVEALVSALPAPEAAVAIARALAAARYLASAGVHVALPDVAGELLAAEVGPRDRFVIRASLGSLAAARGDLLRAVTLQREALVAARAAHELPSVVTALHDLGWAERRAGALQDALTHLQECQRLAAAFARLPVLASAHNELGELYRSRGAAEAAAHHYEEAATLRDRVPGPTPILAALNLARLEVERGRPERARAHLDSLDAASGAWFRGPLLLTRALCLDGADALAAMRDGIDALPADRDARAGAVEILGLLLARWEAEGAEEPATEARVAIALLSAALGAHPDAATGALE